MSAGMSAALGAYLRARPKASELRTLSGLEAAVLKAIAFKHHPRDAARGGTRMTVMEIAEEVYFGRTAVTDALASLQGHGILSKAPGGDKLGSLWVIKLPGAPEPRAKLPRVVRPNRSSKLRAKNPAKFDWRVSEPAVCIDDEEVPV